MSGETKIAMCFCTRVPEMPPCQHQAAANADVQACWYVVVPGAPWGGHTATLGPMTEEDARRTLDHDLPLMWPECPPKLLRLWEDYAPAAAPAVVKAGETQ